jgi:hypothetical protein
MKTLKTKRFIYRVEENSDDTLSIYREYCYIGGIWKKDVGKIENAGGMISGMGGIGAVLEACSEVSDIEEYVAQLNEAKAAEKEAALQQRAEREARYKADYERVFAGDITESNAETVGVLLRYLNTQNWGGWELPKMTIGYSCHQYDCDGKQATTIKLDSPIIVDDEPGTMFQVGAPHGHLMKYRRI